MKKNYVIALLVLAINFVNAQIEQTSYRGAFAPAPTAMWTDNWTNWSPNSEPYTDATTVVNVTADITTNTTWTTGKTYKLTGLIYVRNNATLTIQPGVVIKGIYTNTGTALVITKGAKINAVGTANSPIVFTSAKAAGSRAAGDWGGIILLGKAKFNLNNGVNNIEGITASVNTEYGGGTTPDDNDNSGTLKYVRIEFGGFVFSPNNEINGLTFGAIGRGTTIDNVQVSFSGDDSFEWFGGSVNCKHLVAYRGLDDDFDTDNGYKGIIQFALGIKDPQIADNPAISTSEGFESDNNAAGTASVSPNDNTSAIFTNFTMIGPSYRATIAPSVAVAAGHARAARIRRVSQLKVFNSLFLDFKNSFVFVDGATTVALANSDASVATGVKFKNNIIAGTPDATFSAGVNPTSLNAWFTASGNLFQSGSTGILSAPYGASSATYSGLDYRPGTLAATGADFADASLNGLVIIAPTTLPAVTNKVYCKGDIAPQLTATLTSTGVSLKWYTVATGGTASTTAPTPLTTVVGIKTYYVSQVDASNVESARVSLTVTTNALPTEVVGTIVGTPASNATSATAVGKNVGTTNTYTYTIPAFEDSTLKYLWTVPLGVNIVSPQPPLQDFTNSITVNYANVAPGAGPVGSIQVQAVNTSGCKTLAKTLAITKALPTAPGAITVYNKNAGYPTPTIAVSTYGQYMGTTTPLTLVATTSADAAAYQWELPAGVTLSLGNVTPVTTTVIYTALPFLSPSTAPSTVGTKYWEVTNKTYNSVDVNGVPTNIVVSTAVQKIFGSGAYGATTSQPYAPYGTVITSNLNTILVNFAGVNNPTTTALYFGVKAKNGVGLSTTLNTTNTDVVANANIPGLFDTTYNEVYTAPVPPSTNATSVITVSGTAVKTSKLKKLTAALPAAPAALKLTNNAISTVTGVTVVTSYIGTTTPLTLTATASTSASSYSWELPAGVNQLSGGNSNVITINFAGVAPGVTSLYLGVKSVNGIGSSVTNNSALTPATASTAKVLKVTAALPAAPPALKLTNDAISASTAVVIVSKYIGTSTPLTLTATPSATASSYTWELPAGVNQLSGGTSNAITVNFADVAAGTTSLYLGVKAVNGVGSSVTSNSTATPATASTAKLLKVTAAVPAAVTAVTGQITLIASNSTISYTMTASAYANSYIVTAPAGAVVVSENNASNTSNVLATADLTFSVTYPSNFLANAANPKTIAITSVNGVGNSLTNKVLNLTSAATSRMSDVASEEVVKEVLVSSTNIFPNPAQDVVTIELTAQRAGSLEMTIYSFNGNVVGKSKVVELQEGVNTVKQDVSSLEKGIYVVRFVNTANGEVITKKIIKN
ncbi:MAG: T9SS type A sorting domain-containing protein [Flavobacterium sp.]|nr:T9SS type A sorting domain-containing protein [Flavobacterium sp.]